MASVGAGTTFTVSHTWSKLMEKINFQNAQDVELEKQIAENDVTHNVGINGKGEYRYLDEGKRYVPGTFPKAKKKFFDTTNSTSVFPALPASEPKWPTYPCENCPSTGNTTITPAAAQA